MSLTMTKLFLKLQKKGFKNYVQFLCCVTISLTLITSFTLMLYTSTVQNTLPVGGDSRKQVMMIFSIALIGCFIFTLYAASLFLKYKSRETGIFLVLGAKKKLLSKTLLIEVTALMGGCLVLGLLLGICTAFIIWQLFASTIFRNVTTMGFNVSMTGLLIGLLFGGVVYLALLIQTLLFMKKTNLMDILNDQRRNEPIRPTTKSYGLSGSVMLISGIVLGYGGPQLLATIGKLMPSIWSLTYLLSLWGLYRLMVYLVGRNKRGSRPQKYYQKLISSSMMKFHGTQTVRTMIICTLILTAALIAMYYPAQLSTNTATFDSSPIDFALHYPETEQELTRQELDSLANEHQVAITYYEEVRLADLIVSGIWRDWDDSGKLIEDYHEEYQQADILPISLFNQLTDSQYKLAKGQYYRVITPERAEGFFEKYNDVDQITNPVTAEKLAVSFQGTVPYQPLVNNGNFRLLLNDEDYDTITQQLTTAQYNKQILFNTEGKEGVLPFSKAVYDEFISRASKEMATSTSFDKTMKNWTLASGEEYGYDFELALVDPDMPLMEEWKYYPVMKPYVKQTFFESFAVFFLVFMYLAIICLVAVTVISYTRSITVATNNKLVFNDLQKLGASPQYLSKTLTQQLRNIFIFPALFAVVLASAFTIVMLVGNDGQLSQNDLLAVQLDGIITLLVLIFQYGIYRLSLRKTQQIVGG